MVRRVLAVLAAVLCVGMAALGGWALVLAALVVLWRYHAVSWKQFGGITGDLAGWFLQRPSSGCWRHCVPASGEGCYDLYYRAALQRQAHLCANTSRQASFGRAGIGCRCRRPACLADKLAHEYDILIATEVGGGVVPMDPKQRADREAAGRLACLLAARAECVVQMFCGIPTVLKGELSQC